MKLFEIATLPSFYMPDIKDILSFIEKNCQSYLKQNPDWKTKPLYRGTEVLRDDKARIINSPTDRRPVDTSKELHNMFVKAFKDAGFIANRNNSIFCSGNIHVEYYGKLCIVFPIGDFDFTWSPHISDLYGIATHWDKSNTEEDAVKFIKDRYIDTDLQKAVKSENEIMLHGKFLLVDAKWFMEKIR